MSILVNEMSVDPSVKDYNCDHCDESFMKRKSLTKHVRKSHTELHLELEEKSKKSGNYQCDYCETTFRKEKTLALHIREDHDDEDLDDESVKFDVQVEPKNKSEGVCKVCGLDFTIESELERHMMKRHGNEGVSPIEREVEKKEKIPEEEDLQLESKLQNGAPEDNQECLEVESTDKYLDNTEKETTVNDSEKEESTYNDLGEEECIGKSCGDEHLEEQTVDKDFGVDISMHKDSGEEKSLEESNEEEIIDTEDLNEKESTNTESVAEGIIEDSREEEAKSIETENLNENVSTMIESVADGIIDEDSREEEEKSIETEDLNKKESTNKESVADGIIEDSREEEENSIEIEDLNEKESTNKESGEEAILDEDSREEDSLTNFEIESTGKDSGVGSIDKYYREDPDEEESTGTDPLNEERTDNDTEQVWSDNDDTTPNDDICNEYVGESDDCSENGDLSQYLEVDMASDESGFDSSAEINVSGEPVVEMVEDEEFDQIMEEVKKVKTTSMLVKKRPRQSQSTEDIEEESQSYDGSSRRRSKRMNTDFDGEVTEEDIQEVDEMEYIEEIEEVKHVTKPAFKGRRSLEYNFPKSLPEIPADDIKEMIKKSTFFQNKKSLIKLYAPNHKKYDVIDPSLPSGFKVWEQLRPNGKHVDKEFLAPDEQYVLRSKLAVMEYCQVLLGTSQYEVETCSSPSPKKLLKANKGLKLFKEKIKKSLEKVPEKVNLKSKDDDEIRIVQSLPKGTKVKFTFVPDSAENSANNQTAKKYSCSLCKKIFLTRAGFDTHVKKDHKNARPVINSSDSPVSVKKLICSYCKQIFPSRPDFMQHMADDHPDVNSVKTATTTPGSSKTSITSPGSSKKNTSTPDVLGGSRKSSRAIIKYPCISCNKKFVDHAELEDHKKTEHNFQCSNCTDTFTSKTKLFEHKSKDHSFKCMKCTAKFETKKNLEEHMVVEHYFKCEDCDILYDTRRKMEAHNEEAHTFRCGECKEVFYTEDRCSEHVKAAHESCETCEDEFSWAEADHRCYYTKNGVSPPTERVVEQNLYQGYFF